MDERQTVHISGVMTPLSFGKVVQQLVQDLGPNFLIDISGAAIVDEPSSRSGLIAWIRSRRWSPFF